jgi:hypothetical protein
MGRRGVTPRVEDDREPGVLGLSDASGAPVPGCSCPLCAIAWHDLIAAARPKNRSKIHFNPYEVFRRKR